MYNMVFNVEGMMCPKCEARVVKALEAAITAESIVASHKKGTVEIVCDKETCLPDAKAVIETTGYKVTGASLKKKGLLGMWVNP